MNNSAAPHVMVTSNGGSGVTATAALRSLERRVVDIQRTLQQLRAANSGRQVTGRRGSVRCFRCGDKNHIRRFCPGRRTCAGRRQCFGCGKIGHLVRECPHTRVQGGRPFCRRCRRDGHWPVDCSHSPAAMGGVPARAGAGQAQVPEN